MEEWDEETAQQLRAQAQHAQAKLDGSPLSGTLTPYDPMRMRARLLRAYKGGLTRQDLKTMDYREFFGFIRELDIMLREEAEANKGLQGNSEIPSFSELPRPQEYRGETIQLI